MQCASSLKPPSAPLAGLHLQAPFSSGQPRNTQPLTLFLSQHPPSTHQSLQGLLNLDAADKLTQKLEFAIHKPTELECSVLAFKMYSDQVMCTIQPLVRIGVNGILKWWTSFSLWYLNSPTTIDAVLCLKICNSKASVTKITKSLQGWGVICPLKPSVHRYSNHPRWQCSFTPTCLDTSPSFHPTHLLHPQWFDAKGSRAAKIFLIAHFMSFYIPRLLAYCFPPSK